jgi:uncharacterized protein
MLNESSSSVKVFYADKAKVIGEIKTWARSLKNKYPEIEKIGLFGSYATDTYHPGSDADIIIVLKQSDKAFLDRIEQFIPESLSVGVDVFPYTEREISAMRSERNQWIGRVFKELIWL